MAGQIPIKFASAAVDSASHELTEAAVSNEAVERIAPKDETDSKAKSPASGSDAAAHVAITPSFFYVLILCFYIACATFLVFGAAGYRVFNLTTRSEGLASAGTSISSLYGDTTYSSYEVLVLPGSNKDCSKKPDVDSLEFCVVMQGCPDTPETPDGRCGFEPGVKGRQGSVFRDGMENVVDRTGICQREDNRKRIIAAAGVYSRSITTYSVTCVGPECNFWKTKTINPYNMTCAKAVIDNIYNKTKEVPTFDEIFTHCMHFEPRTTAWSKVQDGLSTCNLFWPTLKKVIREKIPSTSSITHYESQYVGGTFAISGPIKNDRDAWFNMCGFCSYVREVKLYALHSRSRHTPRRLHFYQPNLSCCFQLYTTHSFQQRPWRDPCSWRCSHVL
jgi:hypothetical protein